MSPKSIEALWGKHKGDTAFVVGRGPSVRGFDMGRLKGKLVIAHNESLIFAPHAYGFFCDNGVANRLSAHWPNRRGLGLIYSQRLSGKVPIRQGQEHYIWKEAESFCYGIPKSKNIVGLYTGPVACAYVAYMMGCRAVWFIGLDCYCEDLGNGRVRWYGLGIPERPDIVEFRKENDLYWFNSQHGYDRYPSYFKKIEGTNHLVHPKHLLFGAGVVEMMKWFQRHVGFGKFQIWNANPHSLAPIPHKELPI